MNNWWNSDRSLNTYEEMTAAFNTARYPDKGKPVNQNFRLFKDGDIYKITNNAYGTQVLAEITPDNIITFVAPERHIVGVSQTYVSSFYRWFPFNFHRHRKGLYRIEHSKILDAKTAKIEGNYGAGWAEWNKIMNAAPAYFEGIQFNLLTGNCLNRQKDDEFIERPAERKVWRQALTKFKKGYKARAKVHALDGLVSEILAETGGQTRYHGRCPDWGSKQWLDLLEDSIRKTEYPMPLLKGLVQTTMYGGHSYWRQTTTPTTDDMISTIDKVCNDLSIPLRRRFNVFEKEGHDEQKYDTYMHGSTEVPAS